VLLGIKSFVVLSYGSFVVECSVVVETLGVVEGSVVNSNGVEVLIVGGGVVGGVRIVDGVRECFVDSVGIVCLNIVMYTLI
jgi:hypothetical protein